MLCCLPLIVYLYELVDCRIKLWKELLVIVNSSWNSFIMIILFLVNLVLSLNWFFLRNLEIKIWILKTVSSFESSIFNYWCLLGKVTYCISFILIAHFCVIWDNWCRDSCFCFPSWIYHFFKICLLILIWGGWFINFLVLFV